MSLQLTDEERELLIELLESRLGELRSEIHHSRVSTFTDSLKEREVVLRNLIGKMKAVAASS